eukprot:scaffold4525_cov403-Prasinococcus_capsulatus_cf.AAC.2
MAERDEYLDGLLVEDAIERAVEYRDEAERLEQVLSTVGLSFDQLSQLGKESVWSLATSARALHLRDTAMESFVAALVETSVELQRVQERRQAIRYEGNRERRALALRSVVHVLALRCAPWLTTSHTVQGKGRTDARAGKEDGAEHRAAARARDRAGRAGGQNHSTCQRPPPRRRCYGAKEQAVRLAATERGAAPPATSPGTESPFCRAPGFDEELVHSKLVAQAKEVHALQEKKNALLQQLRYYQDLPPVSLSDSLAADMSSMRRDPGEGGHRGEEAQGSGGGAQDRGHNGIAVVTHPAGHVNYIPPNVRHHTVAGSRCHVRIGTPRCCSIVSGLFYMNGMEGPSQGKMAFSGLVFLVCLSSTKKSTTRPASWEAQGLISRPRAQHHMRLATQARPAREHVAAVRTCPRCRRTCV